MSDESPKGEGDLDQEFERNVHEMRDGLRQVVSRLMDAQFALQRERSEEKTFELGFEYLEGLEVVEKNALPFTNALKREALRQLENQSGTVALKIPGLDSPQHFCVTVPKHALRYGPEPNLDQVIIRLGGSGMTGPVDD